MKKAKNKEYEKVPETFMEYLINKQCGIDNTRRVIINEKSAEKLIKKIWEKN